MGLADRLTQLTKKAKDTAAEHKDQLEQAVDKAAAAADQRTGGKYHDQIAKAEAKADSYVQSLKPDTEPPAEAGGTPTTTEPSSAPADEHDDAQPNRA